LAVAPCRDGACGPRVLRVPDRHVPRATRGCAELRERIRLLNTDEEIERLARRDFNLVFPGEEAYAVLPPPPKAVSLPDAWPFNVIRDGLVD